MSERQGEKPNQAPLAPFFFAPFVQIASLYSLQREKVVTEEYGCGMLSRLFVPEQVACFVVVVAVG
jgi:hypothetical protein